MPKAELHVHLEGSVDAQTLTELDPSLSTADAQRALEFSGFDGFIQSFIFVNKRLQGPADYALVARRLFARLQEQNVTYAEVILSAGVVLWKHQDFDAIFRALVEEANQAAPGLTIAWNLDAVRQFSPDQAMAVVELAAARIDAGVLSFGLGGDELRGEAKDFRAVFASARSRGLRLTCHAGETAGPASIWQALECGAERIGHGVHAVEDPVLVRHLADCQIPLEISITSNLRTGAIASLATHPVRRFHEAGIPIVLNTDDPGMFGCTLNGEFALAHQELGIPESELRRIAGNGFRFAFGNSSG